MSDWGTINMTGARGRIWGDGVAGIVVDGQDDKSLTVFLGRTAEEIETNAAQLVHAATAALEQRATWAAGRAEARAQMGVAP